MPSNRQALIEALQCSARHVCNIRDQEVCYVINKLRWGFATDCRIHGANSNCCKNKQQHAEILSGKQQYATAQAVLL
jgi:hypothetical protein